MTEKIDELLTVERQATVDVVHFLPESVIDQADVELVEGRIKELLDVEGQPHLVLDLEPVAHVSSVMLSTLVEARAMVKDRDGRMALACLHPRLKDLFEITRIDTLFESYLSVEAAVAALLD